MELAADFSFQPLPALENEATQLQYSQIVLLNFNGLSWPHVTVGTLHKA
jgi:hypothetical protein